MLCSYLISNLETKTSTHMFVPHFISHNLNKHVALVKCINANDKEGDALDSRNVVQCVHFLGRRCMSNYEQIAYF